MTRRPLHLLAAATLAAALLTVSPAHASLERAQAAQARGDIRAAQIELRNAVRNNPNDGALRAALAAVSLDIGDGDTAEKEARAALERGFDPVVGTALLLRSYLALGRTRDLLREFPMPTDPARAAVGASIAAARALANLAVDNRDAARDAAEQAVRLAPNAAEAHLAAAAVAVAAGDRAEAEAAVDRAIAADPNSTEAMLRKAMFLYQRNEPAAAAEVLAPLLALMPGNVQARVLRADALIRLGRNAEAQQEVDAALRTNPGSAAAFYLRGVLLGRAQDWRGADEVFQRLASVLAQFPDGFLLAATARRQVGQLAQAEDLAQRHVARSPADPRGAKLLATMQLEANRPNDAVAVLSRLVARGAADAEALDLLGRVHMAARHSRDAVAAFERAVALAPQDASIRSRLAAARLASGDVAGTAQDAQESLRMAPNQGRAREVLAATALARGDLAGAEDELSRLDQAARPSEAGGVLDGTVRLGRMDLPGARASFEAVLAAFPESIGARLGMARTLAASGDLASAEQLWADVLRRDANNTEALNRLAILARPGGPRAATARTALEAVQAASPGSVAPSLVLAAALAGGGDLASAAQVLETGPMRTPGRGVGVPLLRAQVFAGLGRWPEAETEARAVLAEDADSATARRLLAQLMVRDNRPRDAEVLLLDGLRRRPDDGALQQALVGVVQQSRGEQAAFATIDELARQPASQPASRGLRGEFLMSLQRPADAAQAFAAAYAEAPSATLALQQAGAWRAVGQNARAAAALRDWLQREPDNVQALDLMAQIDIAEGRNADAQRRLAVMVERAPTNAPALNNLAWMMAQGSDAAALAQARRFAERAYFLLPNAETADTLGWILARSGEAERALPLLRQAATATGASPRPNQGIAYRFAFALHAAGEAERALPLLRQAATATGASPRPNHGIAYRLAFTLHAAGEREEALRVLEPTLASGAFPERADAERLMTRLRAGD